MLVKNSLKKIKKSFGRYLSLVIIIFIGVGFYTGIIESIPNIKNVQTEYYCDSNLMDIKVLSTLGFNEDEVAAIDDVDGVDVAVGSYSVDVLVSEDAVRVHALEEDINEVFLIDGDMPVKDNQCLADANVYEIGDTIVINDDYADDLSVSEYKVVGTIYSPIYTGNDYGSSDIGNGKLSSFIYINKDNFLYDYYTEVYVTVEIDEDVKVPYTDEYNDKVNEVIENIEDIKSERLTIRIDDIVNQSYGMISKDSLSDNDWYVMDRNDVISTYTILNSQYDQVTTIANIIPIFFILIVALMTSNTMARMIAEERGEMGTLLSLGFSNKKIINTYLMYVLSATIGGAVLGYFIGTIFLPQIVYNCFSINFPEISYHFNLVLFIGSIIVACMLMIGVTVAACKKELKQRPAYLLRPVPPKSGKKIFLENINGIWSKLSFSMKITLRNIARYKNRVLITLIGTAGCCFLIMLGFALRDSINTIGTKQYNDLFMYDNLIILNDDLKKIDSDLEEVFDGLIEDELLLNQSIFQVVDDETDLDVYLIVPEDEELFYDYYILKEENSDEKVYLDDYGVVITPKIADKFDVGVGDKITVESSNMETYELMVSDITENYVSNYIYMNKDVYSDVFGEEATYNVIVSKNVEDNNTIARELLDSGEVISINFSDDLLNTSNEMVNGLDEVVVLLVVISCLLAFTVLYNLTSINISERTREIATLKVLGFNDRESNEYIYRETMITVVVGIIIGLLITPPLHSVIMDFLEVDSIIFLKQINIQSYVCAAVLTFIFAIIMQWVTFFKLKKIDMIESLKSVE